MASRADFCPFLFLPITKPLVTWKRGGLKIFWDSQTHGFGGPQKPFIFILWLTSTGRARLAQTDSRKCPPPPACPHALCLPVGGAAGPFATRGNGVKGGGRSSKHPLHHCPHRTGLLCCVCGVAGCTPTQQPTHCVALRRLRHCSLLYVTCELLHCAPAAAATALGRMACDVA
jgi:hypothetical protein